MSLWQAIVINPRDPTKTTEFSCNYDITALQLAFAFWVLLAPSLLRYESASYFRACVMRKAANGDATTLSCFDWSKVDARKLTARIR